MDSHGLYIGRQVIRQSIMHLFVTLQGSTPRFISRDRAPGRLADKRFFFWPFGAFLMKKWLETAKPDNRGESLRAKCVPAGGSASPTETVDHDDQTLLLDDCTNVEEETVKYSLRRVKCPHRHVLSSVWDHLFPLTELLSLN
jgi:hypothetical protein